MELKQNPFSFYDFLGYFTPGALFLYGALLIPGHAESDSASLQAALESLSFDRAEVYVPFIFLAYTTGHLLSFVSSITVERYSIWAHGYPSKYLMGLGHDGFFAVRELRVVRWPLRVFVAALLLPVSVLDCLLGYFARMRDLYAKSLDNLLINLLRAKVESLVTQHGEIEDSLAHGVATGHDYFRYAYHYAVEHAPHHLPKMQNYVALYGFLRTITLLTVVVFWVLVWHVVFRPMPLNISVLLLTTTSILAFLFFMAFVKFYRRFSLEALMAMSVSFKAEPNRQNK